VPAIIPQKGQLIGRELFAHATASGIQQLAQQRFDLRSLGGLAIQLRHQVEHHLLQNPGIFRKVFGIDCHE
jgi:hypothetical protein